MNNATPLHRRRWLQELSKLKGDCMSERIRHGTRFLAYVLSQ
jgi:hypothetical protein